MADHPSSADRDDDDDAPSEERADEAAEEPVEEAAAPPTLAASGVAPGDGRRRLSFAARYPESAELDVLLDAFEAGNFARVREEAPALAKRTEDPEIARAARDLSSRLSPDPLAVRMLLGAGLLLLFLIYWFYSDHH